MAKITIVNEEGQYLNRYKMIPVDGQADTYDLERAASITKQGTPYNDDTMSHYVQTEDLQEHTENTVVHVSEQERETWNNAVPASDVVTTATANKILRLNASGSLPANITGTSANTTSVAGALTVSTAAPTSYIGAGKIWGVY